MADLWRINVLPFVVEFFFLPIHPTRNIVITEIVSVSDIFLRKDY